MTVPSKTNNSTSEADHEIQSTAMQFTLMENIRETMNISMTTEASTRSTTGGVELDTSTKSAFELTTMSKTAKLSAQHTVSIGVNITTAKSIKTSNMIIAGVSSVVVVLLVIIFASMVLVFVLHKRSHNNKKVSSNNVSSRSADNAMNLEENQCYSTNRNRT